jgi:hypothetical protein
LRRVNSITHRRCCEFRLSKPIDVIPPAGW